MLVDVLYYLKFSMGVFIFSLLVTLILIFLKKSVVSGYSISMLVFVSCIVSGVNMIISGYIADEVPSGGDPIIFYMFFVVLLLCIVNMILVYVKTKKKFGEQNIVDNQRSLWKIVLQLTSALLQEGHCFFLGTFWWIYDIPS